MQYCQRLKEIRQDADKSQKEIAELLETNQSYYAKYENGKHPLPIQHLITLCEFYKVSADYILGLPNNLSWPRGGETQEER